MQVHSDAVLPIPWTRAAAGAGVKSQQFHAVMAENGVLRVDDDSQAALVRGIRSRIQA